MANCTDRTPPSSGVRSFFKKPLFFIILILLLAGVSFSWYATRLILVLKPSDAAAPVVFSVNEGDEWVYHYKHSVQQTPCYEYFRINGPHNMTMTHTIYESYGVGLPYSLTDGAFKPLKKEGKFEMIMNRPYEKIAFRAASEARPSVTYGNRTIDLVNQFGQGTRVDVLSMKRYTFWFMES